MTNILITVGSILGWVGWVVGIYSGWLQWKGYRDQQRTSTAFQEILERAQRDWKGRYTEEQVRELTEQFNNLQNSIKAEIPKQARKVFYELQVNALSQTIAQSYERYSEINKTLNNGININLPESIKKSIEESIIPQHILIRKQQRMVYLLLVTILPLMIALLIILVLPSLSITTENPNRVLYVIPLSWNIWFWYTALVTVYVLSFSVGKRIVKLFKSRYYWLIMLPVWFLNLFVYFNIKDRIDYKLYWHSLSFDDRPIKPIMDYEIFFLGTFSALIMGLSIFLVLSKLTSITTRSSESPR